jgi:hypothetical protein
MRVAVVVMVVQWWCSVVLLALVMPWNVVSVDGRRLGESVTTLGGSSLSSFLGWLSPSSSANNDGGSAHEYDTVPPPLTVPTTTTTSLETTHIVRFDDNLTSNQVQEKATEAARLMGGTVRYLYTHVYNGAAIVVPNTNIASLRAVDVSKLPFAVQPDGVTSGHDVTHPALVQQAAAPSPLDRLDQRSLPLDGEFDYRYDVVVSPSSFLIRAFAPVTGNCRT